MVPAEVSSSRARDWAASDERVAAAIVFGSVAHQTATDWSDLDLLVVARPGARDSLWEDRVTIAEQVLDGEVAFDNEKPWTRPYLYHAMCADLRALDLCLESERAQPWGALADAFVTLVDKDGVAEELREDLARWERPAFNAPLFDSGRTVPTTWNWFAYLAGHLRKGENWLVRYGVMETLNNRVIPLLGSFAERAQRDLSPEDVARLHATAPRSDDASELARSLVAVAEFYEDALNRWAARTGRERPGHPLATEIMRRIRSLPLL